MGKFLQRLCSPLIRWMLSQGKQLETWEREEIQNPFIFISKIRKDIPSDFHKFLTGKLCYLPQTLEDMEQWLRGCEYATDMEQFGKNDYWQHPAEFEKRRKGDCDTMRYGFGVFFIYYYY